MTDVLKRYRAWLATDNDDDVAELLVDLATEVQRARETNARLNRRCQNYERGLAEKLEETKRAGVSLGRSLSVAGYWLAEAEAARLKEALAPFVAAVPDDGTIRPASVMAINGHYWRQAREVYDRSRELVDETVARLNAVREELQEARRFHQDAREAHAAGRREMREEAVGVCHVLQTEWRRAGKRIPASLAAEKCADAIAALEVE